MLRFPFTSSRTTTFAETLSVGIGAPDLLHFHAYVMTTALLYRHRLSNTERAAAVWPLLIASIGFIDEGISSMRRHDKQVAAWLDHLPSHLACLRTARLALSGGPAPAAAFPIALFMAWRVGGWRQ